MTMYKTASNDRQETTQKMKEWTTRTQQKSEGQLSCEQGMTFIIIQLIKPFTRRCSLYSYVLVLWKFNDACLDFSNCF